MAGLVPGRCQRREMSLSPLVRDPGQTLHGPPSEIAGQSCLRFHVHIYRQTFPWGEETKQSMSEGQGATNTEG